jgi:predicted metal-dependent hydrolase
MSEMKSSDSDLDMILSKMLLKFRDILTKIIPLTNMIQLLCVHIIWTQNDNYQLMGRYSPRKNQITINKALKNSPLYVIEFVLWHEILHLKFLNHDQTFKTKEKIYPYRTQAITYLKKYLPFVKVSKRDKIIDLKKIAFDLSKEIEVPSAQAVSFLWQESLNLQ